MCPGCISGALFRKNFLLYPYGAGIAHPPKGQRLRDGLWVNDKNNMKKGENENE